MRGRKKQRKKRGKRKKNGTASLFRKTGFDIPAVRLNGFGNASAGNIARVRGGRGRRSVAGRLDLIFLAFRKDNRFKVRTGDCDRSLDHFQSPLTFTARHARG